MSSPGDLTRISISTAKLVRRFSDLDVVEIRHGPVPFSTLIQYIDRNTVFTFLHIYTSRIEDTGGLGIFTLDSTPHDPKTVNTITSESDCVIELRETDSDREVRVKGVSGVSRS